LCWYNHRKKNSKTYFDLFLKGPQVFQAHKIGVKVATVTGYPECQKALKEDYNVSVKYRKK